MTDVEYTGGCLCGAVGYRIGKVPRNVMNCHCSQCRRTHGHVAAYTVVNLEDFELTEERGLKWYRSSDTARRGFCMECGSSLFWSGDNNERMGISAGTLDEPTGLKTKAHIYISDKGDYYEISDGLPQYDRLPGAS